MLDLCHESSDIAETLADTICFPSVSVLLRGLRRRSKIFLVKAKHKQTVMEAPDIYSHWQ